MRTRCYREECECNTMYNQGECVSITWKNGNSGVSCDVFDGPISYPNSSRARTRNRSVCCVGDDCDYDFFYGDRCDCDCLPSFDFPPSCSDVEVYLRAALKNQLFNISSHRVFDVRNKRQLTAGAVPAERTERGLDEV